MRMMTLSGCIDLPKKSDLPPMAIKENQLEKWGTVEEMAPNVSLIKWYPDLDTVARILHTWFPNWFVYRGGSHVALHRHDGSERLLLVVERT